MIPNIVAILSDIEYGEKFRKKRYCPNPNWEWGMSDDGRLYCRDVSEGSIFVNWFLVEELQLNIDLDTMNRVSRWNNSLNFKNNYILDKEANS